GAPEDRAMLTEAVQRDEPSEKTEGGEESEVRREIGRVEEQSDRCKCGRVSLLLGKPEGAVHELQRHAEAPRAVPRQRDDEGDRGGEPEPEEAPPAPAAPRGLSQSPEERGGGQEGGGRLVVEAQSPSDATGHQ